jgi:hypothetical protein
MGRKMTLLEAADHARRIRAAYKAECVSMRGTIGGPATVEVIDDYQIVATASGLSLEVALLRLYQGAPS